MRPGSKDIGERLQSPFLDEEILTAAVEPELDTAKPAQRETVTLVLDEPVEIDDAFRLVSHDGTYKKTLRARDAKPLVAGERVLRFDGVSPAKRYMLIHQRSKKSTRPVFLALPFKDLTAAGQAPRTARNTYVTLPSQLPRQLPDKHGMERPVDGDLIARAPVLVDLAVEDPRV